MGVEVFGVSLRFSEPGGCARLRRILAHYPQITRADKGSVPGDAVTTWEYDDGAHFIDLQMREIASDEFSLAARYSLCSDSSIDAIFIGFLGNILSSFEADVWLMSSALKQKPHYLPGDSGWLIAALPDEIIEMRKYWQGLFGSKQGVVRVNNSFSFVGAAKNGL